MRLNKTMRLINVEKVQKILRFTDDVYGRMQYEIGFQYLLLKYGHDKELFRAMEGSVHFWAWWKNYWNSVDEEFIGIYCISDLKQVDVRLAIETYLFMHKAEKVIHEPYEVILKSALAILDKENTAHSRIINTHFCAGHKEDFV